MDLSLIKRTLTIIKRFIGAQPETYDTYDGTQSVPFSFVQPEIEFPGNGSEFFMIVKTAILSQISHDGCCSVVSQERLPIKAHKTPYEPNKNPHILFIVLLSSIELF